MKDRVVQFPHRYQLVPVAGQEGVYDHVPVPGVVTEAGDDINKANLLSDATALEFGLDPSTAVPDDALLKAYTTARVDDVMYIQDSMSANREIVTRALLVAGIDLVTTTYASSLVYQDSLFVVVRTTAPAVQVYKINLETGAVSATSAVFSVTSFAYAGYFALKVYNGVLYLIVGYGASVSANATRVVSLNLSTLATVFNVQHANILFWPLPSYTIHNPDTADGILFTSTHVYIAVRGASNHCYLAKILLSNLSLEGSTLITGSTTQYVTEMLLCGTVGIAITYGSSTIGGCGHYTIATMLFKQDINSYLGALRPIYSDGTYVYWQHNAYKRFDKVLWGATTATASATIIAAATGRVWSDGTYLYVGCSNNLSIYKITLSSMVCVTLIYGISCTINAVSAGRLIVYIMPQTSYYMLLGVSMSDGSLAWSTPAYKATPYFDHAANKAIFGNCVFDLQTGAPTFLGGMEEPGPIAYGFFNNKLFLVHSSLSAAVYRWSKITFNFNKAFIEEV